MPPARVYAVKRKSTVDFLNFFSVLTDILIDMTGVFLYVCNNSE